MHSWIWDWLLETQRKFIVSSCPKIAFFITRRKRNILLKKKHWNNSKIRSSINLSSWCLSDKTNDEKKEDFSTSSLLLVMMQKRLQSKFLLCKPGQFSKSLSFVSVRIGIKLTQPKTITLSLSIRFSFFSMKIHIYKNDCKLRLLVAES